MFSEELIWAQDRVINFGSRNSSREKAPGLRLGAFYVWEQYGSRGRIRTYDPLINSQLLYH